jgi:hypothetical protein
MTAGAGGAIMGAIVVGVLALTGGLLARDAMLPRIFARALFVVAALFLVPVLARLWVAVVAG